MQRLLVHPRKDVGVVGDLQHPAPAPQCQVSGQGDADAGVWAVTAPRWGGKVTVAKDDKAAGLQQGPCLGGNHKITFCCVKDCLSLMGGPPLAPTPCSPRAVVQEEGVQVWSHTLGNSVLNSPARLLETQGSVSSGQQHPQVSLAAFFEVRALLSEFCRKGRGATGPRGQCSG